MADFDGTTGNDVLTGTDNGETFDISQGGDDFVIANGGDDVIYAGAALDAEDRIRGGFGYDELVIEKPGGQSFQPLDDFTGIELITILAGSASFGFDEGASTLDGDIVTVDGSALGSNENLTLIGSGNGVSYVFLGGDGNDYIRGGNGNDVIGGGGGTLNDLGGGAGDDTYLIHNSADLVQDAETLDPSNDALYTSVTFRLALNTQIETFSAISHSATTDIALYGNRFAQTIIGNAGANVLDGGGGVDTLIGLAGNDIYVVDRIEDQVLEAAGGGNDIVYTTASYVLGSNQEIETLSTQDHAGTEHLFLTGNQLNNTLIGNAGNNLLNGVAGADVMYGLAGDDTYVIDDAGDLVIDLDGQGNDLVYTYLSHTLSNGNQIETLSTVSHAGTEAINLGGSDYDNTLIGNNGANHLNGGGGADVMIGLGGNDTYVADNALDQVQEAAGGGSDTLFSFASYTLAAGQEIESLSAASQGAATALDFTGNEFGQAVIGNAGANVIDGKGGGDTLYGLGGADFFAFTTALGAGNIDTLADFSVADDTIRLDDAVFAALGGLGTLSASAFVTGSAAADADDRIVYNSATGALLYDADGNGGIAAVQFATLATGLALTASDFAVI